MIIGIFSHFFAVETTLAERQFFRALAKLIGKRAARLSACGIAAIVSKMGYLDEGCLVGADGSLYNVRVLSLFVSLPLGIFPEHGNIGSHLMFPSDRHVCTNLGDNGLKERRSSRRMPYRSLTYPLFTSLVGVCFHSI